MKRARSGSSPQQSPEAKKPHLSLEDAGNAVAVANVAMSDSHSPMKSYSNENENDNGGGWTQVGTRRKLKKEKKVEAKITNNPPRFFYAAKHITERRDPVGISDIRDLVIHLIGDGAPPSWLKVENRNAITKVVVVQIPGLTNSLLNLPPTPTDPTENPNRPLTIPRTSSVLPFISQTFLHSLPTWAPGDLTHMHSVLGCFFTSPVSNEEKKRRILARLTDQKKPGKNMVPTNFLLTTTEMCDNEYPIPTYIGEVSQLEEGWVESPLVDAMDDGSLPKVLAMDCEMCLTEDGNALTRVCIIDYDTDKVILDELVKPPKPITNYLTRFSGITAEHLVNVTTTLANIQQKLLTYVTSQTILLGHSLEQDLRALKFAHPRCIDTALMYQHPRGPPLKPGLAWLTKKWCGREIQTRGEGGHDPEEDARACIELLKKKLTHGPSFGEFRRDEESILERLSRVTNRGSRGVMSAVVDYGNPSTWYGAKAALAIACKSDADILNGMIEAVPQCQFIFGRFLALSEVLEWSQPKTETPPPSVADTLEALNARLTTLYAALPSRTAFIIFTGHSDPRMMASLGQRKMKFENELKGGKTPADIPKEEWWTAADGRALEEETAKARRGLAFISMKVEA